METVQEIYMTYANQVKRFLLCLTADVDLAEELMQETFYQAVKSIDRYDGSCRMSVWLCQIAKHLFYDYLKKKKIQMVAIEESWEIASKEAGPEEQILDQEGRKNIYRQIHGLEEPYREIFLLRALGELPFAEIGELFGRSENWARVTYYRARMKLSERM